ncbi:MAG: radical SAM protein [Desulfobacteraceae bacterium]|nr:MAG: radical SAM protein [Desulfobacteraceae bacterium]
MYEIDEKLKEARELSWQNFGKTITFYVPGMFRCDGMTGKYPSVSITGSRCALNCDHCGGKLLASMIDASTPDRLLEKCLAFEEKGYSGVLITGGCDPGGRLPWSSFLDAISEVRKRTGLYLSVHSGLVDDETAFRLKQAGIDQALIDVVGDDRTLQDIYHVPFGIDRIVHSLQALQKAGLSSVPHIVCGLHYGKMGSEKKAVEILAAFDVRQVVIVSLMPLPGMPRWSSPPAEAVAEVIAEARIKMPGTRTALGCARQRGDSRLEMLALDAGVNRMALPSEEVIEKAHAYGLEIRYQKTCCSVEKDFSRENWGNPE